MASSIIHIAVANEINKKLGFDRKKLLLGSIAPDIAKDIGQVKASTHFQYNGCDYPDMNVFLAKYKDNLEDPFVMGYFIHLYTDYFWFKYFIKNVKSNWITDKEEENRQFNDEDITKLIYNDYTNLNVEVIDYYGLDLDIFYSEFDVPDVIIKEIPYDKLPVIIEKTGIIIENSTYDKKYLFDIRMITCFIDSCVKSIESVIEEMGM